MTAFTRPPSNTNAAATFDALLVAMGHTVTVKPERRACTCSPIQRAHGHHAGCPAMAAAKPKRKVNPNFAIYQTGKAHTNDTHRDALRRATGMKL